MEYDTRFYNRLSKQASQSARHLVPIIHQALRPQSVLDVGCGHGSWLKEWSTVVPTVFGVDGRWVHTDKLEIPLANFQTFDLEERFNLNQKFDLVTCLEVAEHITPASKDNLISSLVSHSDTVLFSAAIPEQGGDNHYNEQWPSYWIEAFSKHGYVFMDPFRHMVWNNEDIRYYYRQNLILFCRKEIVSTNDFLRREYELSSRSLVNVIHPASMSADTRSLKKVFPIFVKTLQRAIKNRIGR